MIPFWVQDFADAVDRMGWINPNEVMSHENRIYIARVGMYSPSRWPQGIYDYVPIETPGTNPDLWAEIFKDCDNCLNQAITVDMRGSSPYPEYTHCPYRENHYGECGENPPSACQAWDPKVWPSLPPDPDPQVQHLNTPNAQNRDTLIARLKSGRVCRAEMQSILSKLI